MQDESRTAPTHSAAWHYEQAEGYLSWASYLSDDPRSADLPGIHLINPRVQQHFVEMAQVHATLALAGATVLAESHSAARAALSTHAEGRGTRDV